MLQINSTLKIYSYLKFICLIFPFFLGFDTSAQEVVTPLTYNPSIREAYQQESRTLMKRDMIDTLQLPFFDDFSYAPGYTNDSLWINDQVYVNRRMAINPPSYGVATFDGLNKLGVPYNAGRNNNNRGLPTDTLISSYIDLSGHDTSSSIYLSFLYQPKGLGDRPERVDSLVLQFKAYSDTPRWKSVWSQQGGNAAKDQFDVFTAVNLALTNIDTGTYFHETFQFRFISFGNLSGNLDHWHVDYVYMNEDRAAGLPTYQDVAIVDPPAGILKEYRALPWRHVSQSQIRDSFLIKASNNENAISPVQCGYEIRDNVTGNLVGETFSSLFSENIGANFGKRVYQQANEFDRIQFAGKDSVDISITSAVTESSDNFRQNDTLTIYQKMHNYMAYDDGTAEAGYGLSDFYLSGQVAYEFSISQSDTLRAIGIKFNRSKEQVRNRRFNLMVWGSLGPLGQNPSEEEVLYKEESLQPRYNGKGQDYYVIYELEEPIRVGGTFYIGWEQITEFNLNVGLDRNYGELFPGSTPENRIFYNVDGSWRASDIELANESALMMRPYISQQPIDYTGTKEKEFSKAQVKVFPNPANSYVNIKINGKNNSGFEGKIYNSKGKKIRHFSLTKGSRRISLDNEPKGLYILNLQGLDGRHSFTRKILLR